MTKRTKAIMPNREGLRLIKSDEPIFFLPPYKVEQVFISLSQTVDWGLKLLEIPTLWRVTKGKGVKIAILDTGIAFNHPELQHAIIGAADFTNSSSGAHDQHGHGTHCAGIIAALHNDQGVVGVAPEVSLLVGKVLNDEGVGKEETIISGLKWAIDNHADIISISFGTRAEFQSVYDLIKEAIAKNIFVIAAAGNGGPSIDSVEYPALFPEVISVGSIDRSRQISKFSSRGKMVDIVAPGDSITSTYPPKIYSTVSGTSMACPFVAGVAALALAKHRSYGGATPLNNQQDLLNHLIKTAIDLGENGYDISYGFGLINPVQLLKNNHQILSNSVSSL